MNSVLLFLYHEIRKSLGIPSRIIELIEKQQVFSNELSIPNDVSSSSVIKWHEWLKASIYDEHHYMLRNRNNFKNIKSKELDSLIFKEESNNEIEIQDINSLSASKSDLRLYNSLDEAAPKISHEHIGQMSEKDLNSCLDHLYKRAWKDDYISLNHYSWYGKNYLWDNGDGSHHFVAARYITKHINKKIYKKARIIKYTVDAKALRCFLAENNMFLFSEKEYRLDEILKNFGCLFGYLPLPSPLNEYNPNTQILILPNNNKRNNIVSKTFSKYKFVSWNKFMNDNLN